MSADHTTTVKGAGLARGPALLVGTTLSVLGLALFFKVTGTPLSTAGFPDGQERGQELIGFRVNAWTAWLTTAAGVVLLIGAAQHLAAKTVSLIVGLVLGLAAIIALIDGDVLGLAAANVLTAVVWGAAAVILLANTFAPRVRRERTIAEPGPRDDTVTRAPRRHVATPTDRQGGADVPAPAVDSDAQPRVGSSPTPRR